MKSKIQKAFDFLNMQGRTGIISSMIPVFFMIFLLVTPGVYFETNDDKTIMEILSGVLTLTPDAHTIYINYFLALPLAVLYRINRAFPWYGCMMLGFHGISYLAISKAIYRRCVTRAQILAGTAFQVIFLCLQVYVFLQIQYTSTAALLAVAGYIVLTLRKTDRTGIENFLLLEGLALLLRRDAFFMIQPFGICLWLGTFLLMKGQGSLRGQGSIEGQRSVEEPDLKEQRKKKERHLLAKGIACIAGLVILLGIAKAGDMIGYGTNAWKEFERYNAARTTLVDYTGIPAYEDVKDILDRYQVTQATYDAIAVFASGEIPVECMEELAEYANGRTPQMEITKVPGEILRSMVQGGDFGVARSVTVIMGMTALWILYTKKWRLLISYLGIMVSHVLVFGYLIYRGRMPYRVTFPLQAGEAIMLMAIMILAMRNVVPRANEKRLKKRNMRSEKKLPIEEAMNPEKELPIWELMDLEKEFSIKEAMNPEEALPVKDTGKLGQQILRWVVCAIGLILICLPAGIAGIRLYRYSAKVNANQQAYLQGTYEILDYCNAHKDKQFLIEEDILMYATGHLLETEMVQPRNGMISHCWYSATPAMREKWDSYFGKAISEKADEKGAEHSTDKINKYDLLRIIVRESEDYSKNRLLRKVMELTGKHVTVLEEIVVSHGGKYAVIGLYDE